MAFGATPLDGSATPIPMSAVIPDGLTTPTALEGGPAVTSAGNSIAPVSIYAKDGNDLTQGATIDSATTGDTAGSISAKLRGLTKIFADVWDNINHRLKVDGSGVTQPVSGTFWQTTQPVSASALPLPTGASTAAKQPALGTAGSASGDVLSVQGIASMTPLAANVSQVNGTALSNANPVPTLVTAQTGYVSAYGSNPATTGTNTDVAFKWGAGGTTLVNHIMINNNSGANINYDLDVATSAGSPVLATGQTVFFDVQTTAVHIQAASSYNLNGTSSGNIVIRGWL